MFLKKFVSFGKVLKIEWDHSTEQLEVALPNTIAFLKGKK